MPSMLNLEMQEVARILSAPRFGRYLAECGNDQQRAIALYLWNTKLAETLLFPLHITEVTLRNAIAEAIRAEYINYGEEWLDEFCDSLPDRGRPRQSKVKDDLRKAIEKEENETPGKVIADLNLFFWQMLLHEDFDELIWQSHFTTTFPNAPSRQSIGENRQILHDLVWPVRKLRNRVTHHEPIFQVRLGEDRDFEKDTNRMCTIVRWRSELVAKWMMQLSRVDNVIASDPRQCPD